MTGRLFRYALATALAAQACAASAAAPVPVLPAQGTYEPRDKDERGLWMQMDEAERELKASPLVMRDPALNAYVRGVLCRLAGDGRCGNIRLYIVRTSDFNASIAANGAMVVHSGLLLRTQNEAQLAAVLGHEWAHYEHFHPLKMFRDIKSKSASAAWLALTGIGLIASFGIIASAASYSRDMEREADLEGLERMVAAGYDTREAAAIWTQLRAEMDATAAARNTKSRKDKGRGIFASHPPSAERVAYLAEHAKLKPGISGATGAEAYRSAMGEWWPAFVDDQLKLNDFGAADYLLGSMAATGWNPWLLYARGELYRRRGSPADLEQAVGFYSKAIEQGASLPELWRGRGLAEVRLGAAVGKADLAEYMRRAPAAPDKAMIAMVAGS